MKIKFLKITTKDKLILHGLLYEPDIPTKRLVLHIHGMAGNFYENGFLDSMAKIFTQNGWSFFSVNTRGHEYIADIAVTGKKEKHKRIGNFRERFEECVFDIKAWVDLAEKLDYSEIVLQGHSLGAVKVVYYLGKTGDGRITRLILASPPDMVSLSEDGKSHKKMLSLARRMIAEGKGEEMLPELLWGWYYLSAKTYIDFGERGNAIDVFNIYDKNKPSILSKIRTPIFAFFGSRDDAALISPQKALDIIKSKAKNCPRFDSAIIAGAPHSYFSHEDEVAKKIVTWLKK